MPTDKHDRGWVACGSLALVGSIGLVLFVALTPAAAQTQPLLEGAISEPPSKPTVAAPAQSPTNHPFTAGKWVLSGYGSAGAGKTSHQVYAGHVSVGYYFIDNLSLNLEGVGYFVDHARNSGGGGVDLLPRWHCLVQDNWSLYLDSGWGFIYTSETLRDPGTHFNFTLQGGAGATYNFTDRFAAMFGARWFHISNARIRGKNRNVGLDSPIFYVGVISPF